MERRSTLRCFCSLASEESASREFIPHPAVEHPARPTLADPAHPDGIWASGYVHPVPAVAAAVDEADPFVIETFRLRGKRAPLHR